MLKVKAPLENGADCRQPASRAATFADSSATAPSSFIIKAS